MSIIQEAAATLLLTAGAALATATTANAALLLYAESDYRAQIGAFTSPMSTHRNMSANANDTLTSFKNYTPYSAAFWHDGNKGGRCWNAAPNDVNRALGWWDDNKVSSFQLGRGC